MLVPSFWLLVPSSYVGSERLLEASLPLSGLLPSELLELERLKERSLGFSVERSGLLDIANNL